LGRASSFEEVTRYYLLMGSGFAMASGKLRVLRRGTLRVRVRCWWQRQRRAMLMVLLRDLLLRLTLPWNLPFSQQRRVSSLPFQLALKGVPSFSS
jgi:hypothetical protein